MSYKLISIAASHYVERARWALDAGQVHYNEDRWPPVLHMLAVRGTGVTTTSVPALVCPDGKVLNDSQAVLQHVASTCPSAASLYPSDPEQRREVDRLEVLFARKLGVVTRVVIYQWLFDAGLFAFLAAVCDQAGTPMWRRLVFKSLCLPIKALMATGMRISPANAAKCLERARAIFSEVDGLLADGRPFLVAGTSAPTAADLTFAALGSVLLLPLVPNYGGASGLQVPTKVLPAHAHAVACELGATPAGKHILKMYSQYRLSWSDTGAHSGTNGQQCSGEGGGQGGVGPGQEQVHAKL